MAVGLAPDRAVHVPPDGAAPLAPATRRDAAELDRQRVLADALGLLERARGLVAAGWVQEAFYVVRDRRGRVRPVSPFGLLLLSRTDVVGACLVGAVSHATSAVDRRSRRAPAGYAVDALWSALAERDDRPAVVADVGHPTARAARVRELARWNDAPERRRTEVLDLIDRAMARTMQDAVR